MSHEKNFVIDNVEYSITVEIQRRMAVITPCLKIKSEKKMILIGSLLVDGHELLPSFRLLMDNGMNEVSLRAIKIIRPLPPPNLYRMELRVAADGFSYTSDIKEIPIEIK